MCWYSFQFGWTHSNRYDKDGSGSIEIDEMVEIVGNLFELEGLSKVLSFLEFWNETFYANRNHVVKSFLKLLDFKQFSIFHYYRILLWREPLKHSNCWMSMVMESSMKMSLWLGVSMTRLWLICSMLVTLCKVTPSSGRNAFLITFSFWVIAIVKIKQL